MKYALMLLMVASLSLFSMKLPIKKSFSSPQPFDQPYWVETMDGKRVMINASAAALTKLAPERIPSQEALTGIISQFHHVNSDYILAINPFLQVLSAKVSAPAPSMPLEKIVGVSRLIKELRKITLKHACRAADFLHEIPLRSVINFSAYALLADMFKNHLAKCSTDAQKASFAEVFLRLNIHKNMVREFILVDHLMDVSVAEVSAEIKGDAPHFLSSDGSGYGIQVGTSIDEPTSLTYQWGSGIAAKPLVYAAPGFGEVYDAVALSTSAYAYLQYEPPVGSMHTSGDEKKRPSDFLASIYVYDVKADKKIWELKKKFVPEWESIAACPNQSVVYAALNEGVCGRYDLRTASCTGIYRAYRMINRVQVSGDGVHLALVEKGDPRSINIFDIRSTCQKPLYIKFFRGESGVMNHGGTCVITPTSAKDVPLQTLQRYEISSKKEADITLSDFYTCRNTSFCISPDGQWLACVSQEKGLSIWPFPHLLEGKALSTIRSWPWIKKGPVVFTPDSRALIFFYPEGQRGFKRIEFQSSDATRDLFEKWSRSS